jgi:YfiH family protein
VPAFDLGPRVAGAFTTRRGGVSEGAFRSLNLGRLTGDEPARVEENRRRLAAAAGVEPADVAFNRQVHGATVLPAGVNGRDADGLVTREPGHPLLVFTADCLPIALVRPNAPAPALALLHAGWRGLLAGIAAAGARALGGGELAACVGPGIGACCYEVGGDVADRFRAAFGAHVVRRGRLDLRAAAVRALADAGVSRVDHVEACTACRADLFFSHRRDGGLTGRQGAVAHALG